MAIKGYKTTDPSSKRQKLILKLLKNQEQDEIISDLEELIEQYTRRRQIKAADTARSDIVFIQSQDEYGLIDKENEELIGDFSRQISIIQQDNQIITENYIPKILDLLTAFYQTSKFAVNTTLNILLIIKKIVESVYGAGEFTLKLATLTGIFSLIYLIGSRGLFGAATIIINFIIYSTAQVVSNTPALNVVGLSAKSLLDGFISISSAMRESIYVTSAAGLPVFDKVLTPLEASNIISSSNLTVEQIRNIATFVKYPAYFAQNAADLGFTENLRSVTYVSSSLRLLRDYIDYMVN